MKRARHVPEQIVKIFREAERFLVEGMPADEVVHQLGVSLQTGTNKTIGESHNKWTNQRGLVRSVGGGEHSNDQE